MRILPDRTGCNHRAVEIMGVYQCSRCSRLFKLVTLADGKWLAADLSDVAPGAEFDVALAELEVDAVYKLGLVRDMLPGLESERATKGVARRLKVILGGD